jgi:hypothetical protein
MPKFFEPARLSSHALKTLAQMSQDALSVVESYHDLRKSCRDQALNWYRR